MCTVTFIKNNKGEFVLTSNRDEKVFRETLPPTIVEKGGRQCIVPQDKEAGGTWIALDNTPAIYCLLNGGFTKHISTNNYKKSRGIIILDLIEMGSFDTFVKEYSFKGLEPFTLIVFQNDILRELKWDGENVFCKELNANQPHIWSSATLYTKEEAEYKAKLMQKLLPTNPTNSEIFSLHRKAFFLESIKQTKTVSISQLTVKEDSTLFYYNDLLAQKFDTISLKYTTPKEIIIK